VHQVKNGPTDICHSASDGGAEDINIGINLPTLLLFFFSEVKKLTHESQSYF